MIWKKIVWFGIKLYGLIGKLYGLERNCMVSNHESYGLGRVWGRQVCIFTFCVIPPYWHDTGSWNPSSSKTRTYLFYIIKIMAADGLAMQGARASATSIFNMLNWIDLVPACWGLRKSFWFGLFIAWIWSSYAVFLVRKLSPLPVHLRHHSLALHQYNLINLILCIWNKFAFSHQAKLLSVNTSYRQQVCGYETLPNWKTWSMSLNWVMSCILSREA